MKDTAERIEEQLQRGSALSVVDLIDLLVTYAYQARSSDIHIEPAEEEIRVRLRIDGVLQTTHSLPRTVYPEIIGRIKVQANLRTDEHQAAQDGRFRTQLPDVGHVDVRVSVVPSYYGESIVLRLLTDNTNEFTLDSLGYTEDVRKKIVDAIKRPHGMILCTGPTGSGKTTTLYTLIKMLNKPEVSIVTIEDPIEYAIPGITQIQVNSGRGLTFASGLRSILRQDPNIIMVGEIRDSETAGIAINTALTGHLVFSTLHTNDAATSLPRLIDMGIESYLIASTVNLIIGQRLVRKNCTHCREKRTLTETELESLKEVFPTRAIENLHSEHIGKGCEQCDNTGFNGRISINEIVVVDESMREAILERAGGARIKQLAIESGMVPMILDGSLKIKEGLTTIDEVLRVINE